MPEWINADQLPSICSNANHQARLLERGSLTHKLRETCPTLRVDVVSEGFALPLADEIAQLTKFPQHRNTPFNSAQTWVRTVRIMCDNQALIYARTVIPLFTPDNPWKQIQRLGNQPLGEILFTQLDLQRTDFAFCRSNHWPQFDQQATNHQYLARCCVFTQANAPLLLTEVFLDFIHQS